jgi:very-short-patch-repair endonuclease
MAATLACAPGAVISHRSAAALWGIRSERPGRIEVSTPAASRRRQGSIAAHRRSLRDTDVTTRDGIPVTCVVCTLVDIACSLSLGELERAVNEADRLDLIDPEALRTALDFYRGQRGVARLRALLDRRTFRLTRSDLERLFLPIAKQVGLPLPLTKQWVNGFEVDFFWPDLGLVVETDGLRYHRTPSEQARDRLRDQAHTAAGLVNLRFTHEQVRYEPEHVRSTLLAVVRRIEAR